MAVVFRPPVFTRIGKVKHQPVFDAPNLLLTTLAVVAAVAPFIPRDSTQPVRKLRVQQVDVLPNRLENLLTPRTHVPFYNHDFTQPRAKRVPQVDVYPLIRTDNTRPPFASIDGPQPRPLRRVVQDEIQYSPLLRTISISQPPFFNPDFPQPRAKRSAQAENITVIYDSVVVAVAPFFNPDFHQPRSKRTPQVDDYTLLRTEYTREPFIPVDGPQPRPLRRVVQDVFQYSPLLRPVVVVPAPFFNPDLPQPRQLRRQTQGDDPQVSSLLSAALPFTQQDFSQPRTKKLIQLQDQQKQLADFVGIPFVPYDGPQLRARRSSQDQQPFNPVLFLVPASSPFYPIDFQQARARRSVQVDNTQSTVLTLPTDTLPGQNSDTSQVRRVRAPQNDYSLNLLTATLAPTATTAPFLPYSDEQPRARRVPQVTGTDNPLSGPLWYVAPSPMPVGQQADPQWRKHREVPDQYLLNTLLSTLRPAVVQLPFPPAQFPQIKPTRMVQRDYAYSTPLVLLNPQSPFKIDGQSSVHLSTPYGTITVYNDGLGNYFSLSRY